MSIFKIALLQLKSNFNQNENLERAVYFCKKAKELNSDLVLFPEMYNIGYNFPNEKLSLAEWKKLAITQEDGFFKTIKKTAQELDLAIGITYLEKSEKLPRNTISIIDRKGNCVLTYAKVHTCDFGNEKNCTAGNDFYVCDLDTKVGVIKIGAMICYDREFPESARVLMLKGAELIVIPNACEIENNRKNQLLARAFENMVGVALANYSDYGGHSIAFDGMAFDSSTEKSRNMLLIEGNEEEAIFLAEFDIDKLRTYRKIECWGNTYRKPSTYTNIVLNKIDEPFIRN